MGLISCPDCGRTISDKAEKCLNCGRPINSQPTIPLFSPTTSESAIPQHANGAAQRLSPGKKVPTLLWILGGSLLLVVIIGVIGFAGYHLISKDPISTVKNGVLEFDKSMTIGNAFDGYQFFKQAKWTEFTTPQKQQIIQVEGELDCSKFVGSKLTDETPPLTNEQVAKGTERLRQYILAVSIVVQFSLAQDKESIQIQYCGYKMRCKDVQTGELRDAETGIPVNTLLEIIYNNRPEPFVWTRLGAEGDR